VAETIEDHTKVDSPYPGSTANVKGPIEMFDWREGQLLVQGKPYYVVLKVCVWSVMPTMLG
jgi:hypothetical protein